MTSDPDEYTVCTNTECSEHGVRKPLWWRKSSVGTLERPGLLACVACRMLVHRIDNVLDTAPASGQLSLL